MSLVVKNALVVTPSGFVHGGVAREDGTVVEVRGDRGLASEPGRGRYVGGGTAHRSVV